MLTLIYHGHSFVEIVCDQGSILVDPMISGNTLCDCTLADILQKKLIAICITHGHADHIGDTVAIVQQVPGLPILTVTGVARRLAENGIPHATAGSIGGTLQHEHFSVKLVPAIHDGTVMKSTIVTTPAGMLIRMGDKTIYHLGDTALTKDLELIGEYENVDVALVPIGGNYTMDSTDGVRAVGMIKPKVAVPIHYNTRPIIASDPHEFSTQVDSLTTSRGLAMDAGAMIELTALS